MTIALGGDRVAWPAHEVQAIINARIAGKTEAEIKALVIELEAYRSNIAQTQVLKEVTP